MSLTPRVATYYKHEQATPASEWTIVHNLHGYPIVDVYIDVDGSSAKIIPASVTYTDDVTVTLTFSTARAGIALVC